MTQLETQIKALDTAMWELSEALKDISEGDAWKRPHPRLLSIGEQAVHIAYWEAQSFLGDDFESPLVMAGARYYTQNVDQPFELPIAAAALYPEVKRVHEACKAAFLALKPEPDAPALREGWTWTFTLEYQAFHVAYHTGQIYSIRHLLGHETPDN